MDNNANKDIIALEEVKRIMQAKDKDGNFVPFSFTAVTYNSGERVTYTAAVFCVFKGGNVLVKAPGSSQLREFILLLITHFNEKEVSL